MYLITRVLFVGTKWNKSDIQGSSILSYHVCVPVCMNRTSVIKKYFKSLKRKLSFYTTTRINIILSFNTAVLQYRLDKYPFMFTSKWISFGH